MLIQTALLAASLAVSAAPATRVAVLIDDPAQGQPATAAIEGALQKLGYEVVAADTSEKMRKVVAPSELLGARLPDGLSVFEADAVLAGAASYGQPADVDGVKSVPVSLTIRLIDLGTGQATTTIQGDGVGVGVAGPSLLARGSEQAVQLLLKGKGLEKSLAQVGQSAGSVTLVVQGLPSRESLLEVRAGLVKALAGAPVKEVYFAKGLGKLILGGSKSDRSMVGPDIADIIGQNRTLALTVDEVANTRIVAKYDRARTVQVHALVLEPKLSKRNAKKAEQLGKYVATQMATFNYARASYQAGKLSREAAIKRAQAIGANVIIESEVLGVGTSAAFALRVLDAQSGRPIMRHQKVIEGGEDLEAAEAVVATLQTELPEKIAAAQPEKAPPLTTTEPTAQKVD